LLLVCVALVSGCARKPAQEEYFQRSRTEMLMGTFVQVKLYAKKTGSEKDAEKADRVIDEAFSLAEKLEKKFNIFDPESEVNRLNTSGEMVVSPELFDILKESKKMSGITGGTFDVTVAPVLKKQGFYKDMPDAIRDSIPEAEAGAGWEDVVLIPGVNRVVLDSGAWVDLSAIAKGYIVDRMADLFRGKGYDIFLINAGGDIYCGKKKDSDWNIGLRKPGMDRVLLVLALKEKAVATSGDYENWIMNEDTGEFFSHIIDPVRHMAMGKKFSSITVIAPTCAVADALATGMMAMDSNDSIILADSLKGVEVVSVISGDEGYELDWSSGAEKYIVWRQR